MKNIFVSMVVLFGILVFSCNKEEVESKNFTNLTSHTWLSDSLLVDGQDASGPGGFLEVFKGEVRLNKDGTGVFGKYIGAWYFAENETKVVLSSDSLAFPLTTNIKELTNTSLKITTEFPRAIDPANPLKIRMTFKAK
jgi:hypothetical protein